MMALESKHGLVSILTLLYYQYTVQMRKNSANSPSVRMSLSISTVFYPSFHWTFWVRDLWTASFKNPRNSIFFCSWPGSDFP